jgi:hypothetical protein
MCCDLVTADRQFAAKPLPSGYNSRARVLDTGDRR